MTAEITAIPYLRSDPHGLMFHRFHSDGSGAPLQGSLSPADFEKCLLFVGLDNILGPDQWVSRLQTGTLEPSDLCLTFDDGLRTQIQYALPVLEKYELGAFWFVCSTVFEGGTINSEIYSHAAAQMGGMDVLANTLLKQCPAALRNQLNTPEFSRYQSKIRHLFPFYTQQDCQFRFLRNSGQHKAIFEELMDQVLAQHGLSALEIGKHLWMDREHLKYLAGAGHWVGLHSYNHPYAMDALSYTEQKAEYQRNYDHLSNLTKIPPRSMSHPLNASNSDTLSILESLGIECGFRSTMTPAPGMKVNAHSLMMAREDSTTLQNLAQ